MQSLVNKNDQRVASEMVSSTFQFFAQEEPLEYYKDRKELLKGEEEENLSSDGEEDIPSTGAYQAILSWEDTRKIISGLTNKSSSKIIPITIPYGFQRVKRLLHGKNQKLYSVLFVPQTQSSEFIVSLDSANMHIWKGSNRIKRISVFDVAIKNQIKLEDATKRGIRDIRHWLFLEKYKVFLVASSTLQLRVYFWRLLIFKLLDQQFCEIFSVSCKKMILCISYSPSTDEIYTGEVGAIRIWGVDHLRLVLAFNYKKLADKRRPQIATKSGHRRPDSRRMAISCCPCAKRQPNICCC